MCHPFFSTSLSSRHRLRLRSNDRVIQDVLKQIGSGKLAQNCATGRSMMILDDTGCLPPGQRQEFWTSKVGQASKRSVRSLPPAGFFQWAVETYRLKPVDVLRAASQPSHFRFFAGFRPSKVRFHHDIVVSTEPSPKVIISASLPRRRPVADSLHWWSVSRRRDTYCKCCKCVFIRLGNCLGLRMCG